MRNVHEVSLDTVSKVGIEEIDSQHRIFVSLMNRVGEADDALDTREELNDLLELLLLYARFHFKTEESMMRRMQFPAFERHRSEHARITEELQRLYEGWLHGDATKAKLTMFLWTWFVDHVALTDVEFGQFVDSARNEETGL